MATSVRPLLTALGINALPAVGWFAGDWSAGTMLVLYWLETLIGTLLLACRIVLRRRVQPRSGHWEAPQREPRSASSSSYLSAFLSQR